MFGGRHAGNEYNIMVTEEEQVFIIDFPQMTSTEHLNAQMYFDRDLCSAPLRKLFAVISTGCQTTGLQR